MFVAAVVCIVSYVDARLSQHAQKEVPVRVPACGKKLNEASFLRGSNSRPLHYKCNALPLSQESAVFCMTAIVQAHQYLPSPQGVGMEIRQKITDRGARTHDHQVKSLALYRLS